MFASEMRSGRRLGILVIMLALIVATTPAAARQNKKDAKKNGDSGDTASLVNLPDAQAVDVLVSQMLGAWQVGNVEMLHKSYADDVMVVSAAWEPPLVGWESYAKAYQAQFARTNGGRLERSNSVIKMLGDSAWVTYQWQFTGQVDGNPANAFGHTTLILQKRGGTWLIVLNHTSAVPSAQPAAASQPARPQPGAPQK
jgi:uncharacterized protein (TIGR02246 family)